MRVAILCLLSFLSFPLAAKVSVPLADGEEGCVKKEIRWLLRKTKHQAINVDQVRYHGTWGYHTYEAKVGEEKFTGFIYAKFTEGAAEISCELNYRPNWILPNPWHVFALTDESGANVESRCAEIRVRGKRYRF